MIFYYNEKQKKIATESKNDQTKNYNSNIVTEISEAKEYYKAEDYHQKYIEKTGLHCNI